MKKESTQQYLKAKNEAIELSLNIEYCNKEIEKFNTFLDKFYKEWLSNKELNIKLENDIKSFKYWYPNIDISSTEKIINLFKEYDTIIKEYYKPIEERISLELDLETARDDAKNATKDESHAYCAGLFCVGFHHEEVPDYEARRKAEFKVKRIKKRLKELKELEKKECPISQWAYLLLKNINEDINEINAFKSTLKIKVLKLKSLYQNACNADATKEELEIKANELKNTFNNLYETYKKLERVQIPNVELKKINTTLLNSFIEEMNQKLDIEPNSWKKQRFIEKMIYRHINDSIMPIPKLDYDYNGNGYLSKMIFKIGKFKAEIHGDIYSSYCNISKDIKLLQPFNENGIAVIGKCYFDIFDRKEMRKVAVDLLGNEYDYSPKELNIDCRVKSILNVVYDKITINEINDEYFNDSNFVEVLYTLWTRKYFYDKGLTEKDKKHLTFEDKREIKNIKKLINKKVKCCKFNNLETKDIEQV